MKPASEMHLETALPPASRGLFASLRERLAKRPDTEHQAAIIRIVIALIVSCYLMVTIRMNGIASAVEWHVMAFIVFIVVYSIAIFASILISPNSSVPRRLLSITTDLSATTYALSLLGDVATPFFGMYLFNICGNGFRFGRRYLYLASALSILGFAYVLTTSEYWAAHRFLGVGLLIVLIVIPLYFASLVRELHTALARMRTMATHDTLTGLPNRHSFYEQLQHSLRNVEQSKTTFAVMFIDLDGFKPINDTLGHAAGDEVLKTVANRLKQCVRRNDVVARIGGDEFVITLSGIDATSLLSVVHKIIDTIAAPYIGIANTVTLTSSVGIATYPDNGRTVDELVAHADAAMYRSKRAGRNYFCLDGEPQTLNAASTHMNINAAHKDQKYR
jgi:diguanylate cyclase (GGDEF)-like protein